MKEEAITMVKSAKNHDKPAATSADTRETGGAGAPARPRIRLAPVDNADQPVLANYTSINPAPGMAFIDFGFLEPAMLAAIPRVAKQGGKLPKSVNGKLAVRVAMGYGGLAGLQQQIGRVLAGVCASAQRKAVQWLMDFLTDLPVTVRGIGR